MAGPSDSAVTLGEIGEAESMPDSEEHVNLALEKINALPLPSKTGRIIEKWMR